MNAWLTRPPSPNWLRKAPGEASALPCPFAEGSLRLKQTPFSGKRGARSSPPRYPTLGARWPRQGCPMPKCPWASKRRCSLAPFLIDLLGGKRPSPSCLVPFASAAVSCASPLSGSAFYTGSSRSLPARAVAFSNAMWGAPPGCAIAAGEPAASACSERHAERREVRLVRTGWRRG